MIPCRVAWVNNWPVLGVTFPDGRSRLLQSDWDYTAFCFDCGAPIGSGDPSSPAFNRAAWDRFDPSTIERCPAEYAEGAL